MPYQVSQTNSVRTAKNQNSSSNSPTNYTSAAGVITGICICCC